MAEFSVCLAEKYYSWFGIYCIHKISFSFFHRAIDNYFVVISVRNHFLFWEVGGKEGRKEGGGREELVVGIEEL